jgi:hypothetical protein
MGLEKDGLEWDHKDLQHRILGLSPNASLLLRARTLSLVPLLKPNFLFILLKNPILFYLLEFKNALPYPLDASPPVFIPGPFASFFTSSCAEG